MVAFFFPPAFASVSPPPSGGYSFTMTAGDIYAAGVAFGYLKEGYFSAPTDYGSIDQEPVPGHALIMIAYSTMIIDSSVVFLGDATALLSGKTVWVDGIEYADDFSGWSFNSTVTAGDWTANPASAPVFVGNEEYFIEIK